MVNQRNIESIIDEVFSYYENFGDQEYVGEQVTQLQHAQQVARHARHAGASEEVQLGAFFHDIGHLIGIKEGSDKHPAMFDHNNKNIGTARHEHIGAEYLKSLGFPDAVADFVLGHVLAKRYLVYKYPEYHAQLSEASKGTLISQGGPMDAEEAGRMEAREDFEAVLAMRRWDDLGKDVDVEVVDNVGFKELCRKVLEKQKFLE